jgi:hypothetical protein
MVHVLDSLARLELKFDNFASHHSFLGSDASARTPNTSRNVQSLPDTSQADHIPEDDFLPRPIPRYQDLTVPHKVFLWPSISALIAKTGVPTASDIQCISEMGTPWLVGLEMAKHPLPLSCGHCQSNPRSSCWSDGGGSYNPTSPLLSAGKAREYADAYFDTFGVLYPVLDQDVFMTEVVARVLRNGYVNGDIDAVLALTVFALGQTAIEGTLGGSISRHEGVSSGFRGGSVENPPGIELFCEARRRLGFVVTSCSLENIQILLLQGTYYEANARHLEFWRCVTAASMACQMLIRCQTVDWSSHHGGMLARAYWACSLSENLFHLDLDLPQTGIQALEDDVPLPYFRRAQDQESLGLSDTEVHSHSQYHYLAMITLRRLIMRIHDVVHGCRFNDWLLTHRPSLTYE